MPARQKYLTFKDTKRNTLGFCYNTIHYNSEFGVQIHPGCHPNWTYYERCPVDFFLTLVHLKPGRKNASKQKGSCRTSLILAIVEARNTTKRPPNAGNVVFQTGLSTHHLFSLCKLRLLAIKFSKERKMNYSLCLQHWTAHLLRSKCSHTSVFQIRFGESVLQDFPPGNK